MNLLLDHKEVKTFSNTKSKINVLGCNEITTVRDNILLLKTRDGSFLKEQVGTWMNTPVVKFNTLIEGTLHKDVPFVVQQGVSTQINLESLGVSRPAKPATVLVEKQETKTNTLITEQVKQDLGNAVKVGKRFLENVAKTEQQKFVEGTKSLVKGQLEIITGDILGELEVVKENIIEDISAKNYEIFKQTASELSDAKLQIEAKLKHTLDSYVSEIIQEKSSLLEKEVKSLCNAYTEQLLEDVDTSDVITELYEKYSEPVIKRNLENLKKEIKVLVNEASASSYVLEEVRREFEKRSNSLIEEAKRASSTIDKRFEDYRKSFNGELDSVKTRILRVAESGGGTNAVQYANGGTIDGSLVVSGDITIGGELHTQTIARRVVTNVGDEAALTFTITHNLNTQDCIVQIFDNGTNQQVSGTVINDSLNTTTITFSDVPDLNQYRVVIL